ncbi:DUF1272 domain-containing protein [Alkalihalobacillus sp. AL-G]|uniref:DUF1272 domain-containing protein n=1 Tax=Alkalihalobacillus sp. AL-G TaxID=2926399 RepID=UPI0027295917|nr:DUF1272 domain-containing protein [Alkalihalobacillus sp. AL-G]WLD94379.1 DUF1272 domain-containing protein [Alkalihalobacillus sp. AL-G]
MSLLMKGNCEDCKKVFTNTSDAYICVHECTFCDDCTNKNNRVCPNCGGELVLRPKHTSQNHCPIN